MTEAQWLACSQPGLMWAYLRGRASDRKLRLFGCGCVRAAWEHLKDPRSRVALEVAERYADGRATPEEMGAARDAAYQAAYGRRTWAAWAVIATLGEKGDGAMRCVGQRMKLALLRDIFGNPFRPVAVEDGWLAWNAGTVRRLAEAAYQERLLPQGTLDPGRLAVLADALEEAGCANVDLLGHLRGPGPHYPGCWAVDLLSGRG